MFRVFAALAVLMGVAVSGAGVADARPATPQEQQNAAAKAKAQKPCCRSCK